MKQNSAFSLSYHFFTFALIWTLDLAVVEGREISTK